MKCLLGLFAFMVLLLPALAAEPFEELFGVAVEKPGGMAFDGECAL